MRDATLQRDRSLGLSAGGAVVSALRAAAFRDAPPNGRAEFLATIDAAGFVISLEPTRSTSAAWKNVAATALRALKRKRVRPPSGAAALGMRLSLESKVRLPSGRAPGIAVNVLGIPLKRAAADSTSVDVLKPQASLETIEVPDPGGGKPLRVPALQIGLTILGVKGDPVDIGANPQRVVHVTILDEQPL
jgi:hypothetical protein